MNITPNTQYHYQIERAISKLKEAPGYKHQLQIPTVDIINTVIAELEAFLDKKENKLSTNLR